MRKVLQIWNKFLLASIYFNKQWNRYFLDITRKFNYNMNGETKQGFCTIILNLTTAKALIDQLPLAYQFVKTLYNN